MKPALHDFGASFDLAYWWAIRDVLHFGTMEQTGAKVGGKPVRALSYSGIQVSHDLAHGFPMLQLRRLSWKTVCLETAFFLRGETHANWLADRGCTIWKRWAGPDGDLGPIYGAQWRNWERWGDGGWFQRIDQLAEAYDDLANCLRDPSSRARRRIVVQAWNPSRNHEMALPPCHTEFQLDLQGGRVHLRFTMRSCDLVTGLPHNMASYALILCMICDALGATPGRVNAQITNAHIYENQLDDAWQLYERPIPVASPLLARSGDDPIGLDLFDRYDPAEHNPWSLVGYDPHPAITIGDVAV